MSSTMKIVPHLEDHCLPKIIFSNPITKARILEHPGQWHRTRVPPSDGSRQLTNIPEPWSVTLWMGLSQTFSPFVPGITLGRSPLSLYSATVYLVTVLLTVHSDELNTGAPLKELIVKLSTGYAAIQELGKT